MKRVLSLNKFISLCFILLFIIINTNAVIVSNEDELLTKINSKEKVLNINNEITVTKNETMEVKSTSISIIGNSDSSVLRFSNNIEENIHFLKTCEVIEINDITIYGNLKFFENKKITLKNVMYNGFFISDNSNVDNQKTISILNSEFNLPHTHIGYQIYNYNLTIDNSKFYGNDVKNMYLMSVMSSKDLLNNLEIKNSLFSGNYRNSGIETSYTNITCEHTRFEKCFNGKELNGGGALTLSYAQGQFYDINFEDNISENSGGSISLKFTLKTYFDIISFKNSTSLESGHTFSVFSDSYKTTTTLYNITQIGNNEKSDHSIEGTFFSSFGSNRLIIENYNGIHLNTGSVMSFEGDSKATLLNLNFTDVYIRNDGSLIKTYDPYEKGANIYVEKSFVYNITQESDDYSAAIISTDSGFVKLNEVYYENIKCHKSGILYQHGKAKTHIRSVTIKNFYSEWPEILFFNNVDYSENEYSAINFFELNLIDVYQDGVIFYTGDSIVEIHHSYFKNIHECYKHNDCNSFSEKENNNFAQSILFINNNPTVKIDYSTFEEIYGKSGMNVRQGTVMIQNTSILNSYFEKGFIYYTNEYETSGMYMYTNLNFNNNRSYRGTFLYFDDIVGGNIPFFMINGVSFNNNTASSYGGIIYSTAQGQTNVKQIGFSYCNFSNNNALLGKISYVYDLQHEFSFYMDYATKQILNKDKNNFVTNPTKINFENYNNSEVIEINSGDRIEKEYICNIYDDYGNKFEINGDISETKSEDLVFYELSLYGKKNALLPTKVFGSYKGYCFNNSCKFKDIRLVANPGDYVLELKIISYGQFNAFKTNSISMNVKIKECNLTERISQDRDGININSCYKPICSPPCANKGICVNDNLCNCKNTYFKGETCSERYKQNRYKILDLIIKIVTSILIITTIIIIALVYHYKNVDVIKAASFDFLNFILIGIILNYIYGIFVIKERFVTAECILSFYFEQIGFTLIFGSILIKTYRIYYIFMELKRINKNAANDQKYYLLIFLIIFHSIITVFQWITKSTKSVNEVDSVEREYNTCKYSNIFYFSQIVDIFLVLIGSYFAYEIRNINKKFKEPLSVPFYVYIVYIIFIQIMNLVNNHVLIVYFKSLGIIIYSTTILYFLFIIKFDTIKYKKKVESMSSSEFLKNSKAKTFTSNTDEGRIQIYYH
ncbi:hypothetical protein H8356DRAFT_1722918 [Neocallimastix lanati (nom. inval.)]|uniref:G-protein coupled receptors family 3 profile domain-containing protein n=1 Tax=Neocallimastix californiae TaxID=1754190 RepID=A0A1Y2FPC1_9FUNG|nr:hypothetical protein H8356DRAFT_1722918 [Neocallimastix sp. JGI-2020a]ORY85779.1 hypothetical protein LY90DRAFT_663268 [Neocallimastix californiae]|eukprot:ORY85779.1 hypothetical protein LY90DRAFT_663268 [Neocallimastix californiae]